ncbi:MAG: hypothetical protein NVS9B14_19840 [Candidatus Acidiferrum sp.]
MLAKKRFEGVEVPGGESLEQVHAALYLHVLEAEAKGYIFFQGNPLPDTVSKLKGGGTPLRPSRLAIAQSESKNARG